jgi:hypothetical protein
MGTKLLGGCKQTRETDRQTDQRNEQVKSQFDKLKKFFLKTTLLQPKTKHMRKISSLGTIFCWPS